MSTSLSNPKPQALSDQESVLGAFCCPEKTLLSPDSEERSSLDLIYGHLTYTPISRAAGQAQFKNWYRPSGVWSPDDLSDYVVSVQRFGSGGYEVTCSTLDLQRIAYRADAPRQTGARQRPDQIDPESKARASMRAKKQVRYRIKSMGCDRLFTLTRREDESRPDLFWTREQWLVAWDRFIRLCKQANVEFEYVAVLEHHKKGNLHLHAAVVGRINVKTARKLWLLVVGGKGMGNVDVRFKQNVSDYQRRAGLAKYVSKYVTKGFDELDSFNKKRYFSSRHTLPDKERIVLRAKSWVEALSEICDYFQLIDYRVVNSKGFFEFPNKEGFWFNFSEEIVAPCPF